MSDTFAPTWRPPFRADGEFLLDAEGVTVAKAFGPNMAEARAAAIADALNAHYGPWQPPEDPPEDFACLGWCYGAWRCVLWCDGAWHTSGLGKVRPSAFRPAPPPPEEGQTE